MAHKSQIRQKIEEILNCQTYTCFIDKRVNDNYRMKLVTNTPATEKQKEEILKLPHVLKVGYFDYGNAARHGFYSGITIYFDKAPSKINS